MRTPPPTGSPAPPPADERLHYAPCAYLLLSTDRTIAYANATLTEWLGYAAGSFDGASLSELLSPTSLVYFETHIAPIIEIRGGVQEVRASFQTLRGEPLPVLVNAKRQLHEGRVVIALVAMICHDARG